MKSNYLLIVSSVINTKVKLRSSYMAKTKTWRLKYCNSVSRTLAEIDLCIMYPTPRSFSGKLH